MTDELKAAVERAYAHAFSRYGLKEGAPISHIIRALADEPEVLTALRIDDEVHAADIRDILQRLAEIVK